MSNFIKFLTKNWLNVSLAFIAFLLPWQARWIYGNILIDGERTEFGVMSLYAIEVAILALGAIVLYQYLQGKLDITIRSAYQLPIRLGAIGLIIIILGTGFSHHQLFALSMTTHLAIALIFLVLCLIQSVELYKVLIGFVAGSIAPIVLGIIQVFGGSSPANTYLGIAYRSAGQLGDAVFTIGAERVLRAYGSFSHPNVFGGYLGVALFAFWYLMFRFRGQLSKQAYHLIGTFGTSFLLFALLLTGSRSAIFGVIVGLLVMMSFRFIRSLNVAKLIASIILIGAIGGSLYASFALPDVASSLRGGGVNEERSITQRIELYKVYVPIIQSINPMVGAGYGAYVLTAADLNPGKSVFDYQPVHSAWALALAEIGGLGMVMVLLFLASIHKIHHQRLPRPDALYGVAMVIVLLVISFYDHYPWSLWSGLILLAFVGAMMMRLGEEK